LLNNKWVKEEIRVEIKRYLEFNEHEHATYHNFWNTAKAVLRGNFILISAHIKRTKRSQRIDLRLQLKLLEKQEQEEPPKKQRDRNKKIKADIYEIETKNTYKESVKEKAGSLKN
jgi:hypothetical protein